MLSRPYPFANISLQPGDPEPKAQTQSTTSGNKNSDSIGGMGSSMYLLIVVGVMLAAAAFYVTQK